MTQTPNVNPSHCGMEGHSKYLPTGVPSSTWSDRSVHNLTCLCRVLFVRSICSQRSRCMSSMSKPPPLATCGCFSSSLHFRSFHCYPVPSAPPFGSAILYCTSDAHHHKHNHVHKHKHKRRKSIRKVTQEKATLAFILYHNEQQTYKHTTCNKP